MFLHQQKQNNFEVGFFAGQMQGSIALIIFELVSCLEIEAFFCEHPEHFELIVQCGHMSGGVVG